MKLHEERDLAVIMPLARSICGAAMRSCSSRCGFSNRRPVLINRFGDLATRRSSGRRTSRVASISASSCKSRRLASETPACSIRSATSAGTGTARQGSPARLKCQRMPACSTSRYSVLPLCTRSNLRVVLTADPALYARRHYCCIAQHEGVITPRWSAESASCDRRSYGSDYPAGRSRPATCPPSSQDAERILVPGPMLSSCDGLH